MCVLSHGLLCKINNTIPLTSIGSTGHGANVKRINKEIKNFQIIYKTSANKIRQNLYDRYSRK